MRIPSVDEASERPRNGIAAMVDISFLLLIFFLVATTIQPTEQDLGLQLPVPCGGGSVPSLPMVVEIANDGTIWWGDGAGRLPVEDEGSEGLVAFLKPAAEAARSGGDEPFVQLRVGDEVSQQRFTDVMNAFAGCDVQKVALVE